MIFKTNAFSFANFFFINRTVVRNGSWKKDRIRSDFASPVGKRCFSISFNSNFAWSRLLNNKRSLHWRKSV